MTIAKLLVAASLLTASLITAEEALDAMLPDVQKLSAESSIEGVFNAAQASSWLSGISLEQALQDTVATAQDKEGALSVSGETITWSFNDACYTGSLNESDVLIIKTC